MSDFLDKLIDSLDNGNILLAVVIMTVALIFNYKKIVEFLEERKKARITKLTEALKCDFVHGLTKEHLQEELATEQFKIATGIHLEKQFREAVIRAHQSTNGELSFIHFKRALPHLIFERDTLRVEVTKFDKVSSWFNYFFGSVLAFVGLVLLVLPSQMDKINFVQFFTLVGLGSFFITVCLFMFSQTFPVASAERIKKKVSNIAHSSSIQSTAD